MKRLLAICLILGLLLPTLGLSEEYEDEAGDESGVMISDDDDGIMVEDTTDRELRFGDEGDDVAQLQQKLTDLSYYSGNISGRYREGTRAAVKSFQSDFGLEATGEADTNTLNVIYSTLYRPLRYGSSGEDVKKLQTRLMELGYYTGKVSGNYLEGTQSAIANFQRINGEDSTGVADPDTQLLLFDSSAIGKNDKAAATSTPTPTPAADSFLVDENASGQVVATSDEEIPYTTRLAKGSKGELVKQVQQRLTDLGYYTGPISGNFLGKTQSAVKTFQEQNALDVNGVVGENTWNTLFNDPGVVLPDNTPKPTPEPTPVPFYIVVDVNNQVTTVYGRDENGDYTVVVRQMLCSTGTKKNPSDLGEFTLNGRHAKWCYFPKFGSHARYWTRINASIAFHSVIYNSVNTMDMSTSSYYHLGSRASHGCVRLTVADSKWIYDNIGEGTKVLITEDLPDDPELRDSLKLPDLDKSSMTPKTTPEPTASPVYVSGGTPPLPLEKLSKNDSSEAVYWLQCRLTELGYYSGKCSGTYLGGTVNAVKAFQKDHGLKASGTADVKTLEAIYEGVLPEETEEPN